MQTCASVPPSSAEALYMPGCIQSSCSCPEVLLAPVSNWFDGKGKKEGDFYKSSQPQLRDSLYNYQTEFNRVEITALISPSPGRRGLQSSGWRWACWIPCIPLCLALAALTDLWCYTSLMLKKEHLTKLSCK